MAALGIDRIDGHFQRKVEMNNSLGMREAILNGAGIMRAPSFVVGEDIQRGRLTCLLPA